MERKFHGGGSFTFRDFRGDGASRRRKFHMLVTFVGFEPSACLQGYYVKALSSADREIHHINAHMSSMLTFEMLMDTLPSSRIAATPDSPTPVIPVCS